MRGPEIQVPSNIQQYIEEILEYARDYGLDSFETIFEVVDYAQMNEFGAYGGFPGRFPHWRFGMEFQQISKGYEYGLHKIYEMVINNDPCYAYLLVSNNEVDQKIVIGHVFAHSDFFKNNLWFAHTDRNMLNEMANHGTRIRNYIEKHGHSEVEDFIDICFSIENLIDLHQPYIKRRQKTRSEEERARDARAKKPFRLRSKQYMDPFINPRHLIEAERNGAEASSEAPEKFPEHPERDIMLFLIEHAPLKNWQRDIASIIREESYYFAPQGQTKIMNEGWATYWHSRIMTERALRDAELVDYADHHSGTLSTTPGRLNPYKLGVELFRDIEDRWNKGRFGKEYEQCDNMTERKNWDLKLGFGRKKIFEVRRLYNDVTFIDEFLTPEFCEKHKLFTFRYNPASNYYEIDSRKFKQIKEKLLFSLTNLGHPIIFVEDGNYKNSGELLLRQVHEGVDLRMDQARDVLRNIGRLWKRPVHLDTMENGKPKHLCFDGQDVRSQ
ncbi:MAG: SpoVR family protein [Deltaproteobacteria bacterium]|nr:SpoVR family protein [Deltaproteobacteria bacterium]